MRRQAFVGVFLFAILVVTAVMVAGAPVPVVRAGNQITGALSGAIGSSISTHKAAAASGAPYHHHGVTVYHNLVYGHAGGQDLLLDAYIPDGGPHPAVVVIHGGGWAHGNKAKLNFEGERLSTDGFAAFVVNYRMAPPGGDWHAPAALEDVRTAVVWVRANASTYHVDSHRVGALGNSAGANLAMMLGTTGIPGEDRVDAVVEYSGQSALLKLSPPARIRVATNYVGCPSSECPGTWRVNSPIEHVDSQTVPMMLVNSNHELMPLDQATGMAAKLQQLGLPHELIVLQGDKHASEVAGEVWPQTIGFLHQYLGS